MLRLLLAGTAALALSGAAQAQLLLSANDNKMVIENGEVRTLREPAPDTLSIIDLSTSPPSIRAEIAAPARAGTPEPRLALAQVPRSSSNANRRSAGCAPPRPGLGSDP